MRAKCVNCACLKKSSNGRYNLNDTCMTDGLPQTEWRRAMKNLR